MNQCKVNRVYILRQMGDFERAIEYAYAERETLAFHQDPLRFANLLMEAALCRSQMGNSDEAFKLADEAISLIKTESERWPQLQAMAVRMLMDAKQYEEAIRRIGQILAGPRALSLELTAQLTAWRCQALLAQNTDEELLDAGSDWFDLRLRNAPRPGARIALETVSFPAQ